VVVVVVAVLVAAVWSSLKIMCAHLLSFGTRCRGGLWSCQIIYYNASAPLCRGNKNTNTSHDDSKT
jgi:hypothetical protein